MTLHTYTLERQNSYLEKNKYIDVRDNSLVTVTDPNKYDLKIEMVNKILTTFENTKYLFSRQNLRYLK